MTTAIRALLVEDDDRLARFTREYLEQRGVHVTHVRDGEAALATEEKGSFDVVVLDVMLPGRDGFEVCRALRKRSAVPIIVVSARTEESDRVLGLELGADDYLVKPFSPRELLARLNALVRRATGHAGPPSETVRVGRLSVDLGAMRVSVDGADVPLTSGEFLLLRVFVERRGRVLSRDAAPRARDRVERRIVPDRAIDDANLAAPSEARRRSEAPALDPDDPRRRLHVARQRGGRRSMKLFGRFRLRLLAHGLALMILMAAAVAIADRVFVNAWVEKQIEERRTRVNIPLSIGPDGTLLATKADPPIDPPPPDVLESLANGQDPIQVKDAVMTGVFRDGAFAGVVARKLPPPFSPYPGPPLGDVVVGLGLCIIVTLLASIPLSRGVVRPVEALARSVRRFGSGELSARSNASGGDEIADLAATFDEMAAQIESLVRNEQRLLADVSHELRTPLARIRVVLELASDGEPERARSYLPEIARDLAELETLVDDVLTNARLEMTKARVEGGRVPLHRDHAVSVGDPSTTRELSIPERMHPAERLVLETDVDGSALDCDPTLLRRAIDNLLDNAAKHAPGARIVLRAGTNEREVRIDVVDEGPGMSKEAAERAFEPFFRGDASRDRRTGGVGLGLAIVRTIVDTAHGGRVDLESVAGRGTTMTIFLPRAPLS